MGVTIGVLMILVVSELAFTTYCLITRSTQVRVRSWVRIGLLAAFLFASLATIIQWWTFRWYLLAALLMFWAALGAWRLSRGQPEQRAFVPWRTVLGAVARLLLILIALLPAILLPQFKLPPPTGTYAVASVVYTYTDTSRVETFTSTGEPRKVNVGCWYPHDADGKYPLVIFSHGAFGMRGGNLSTFMNLASNGYVACSIDHPYHSLFTMGADGHWTRGDSAYIQEVLDWDNDMFDPATSLAMAQKWMALRVDDMQFVLNTLKEQAQSPGTDELYQRIDLAHIGLFGHSLGGATSAAIARQRDDIDAVIDMDGTLFGEYVGYVDGQRVTDDTIFPVPILIIATDALGSTIDPATDPEGRNPINHILATAPNAYKAQVKGSHFNVTDVPLISPVLASAMIAAAPDNAGEPVDAFAAMERTNQLVLTFFDAHLKGAGSFVAR